MIRIIKSSNALARSGRSRRIRSKLARVNVKTVVGPSDDTVAERTERLKKPISPTTVYVAMRRTRGARSRLARPSTAFCSWIAVGRPRETAASIVGIDAYPPKPMTQAGESRRNKRRACNIPSASSPSA